MPIPPIISRFEPSVQVYDYIFCGAGAAASLMILALHKQHLLPHKKVLLIDPEQKNKKDKTFCFWANQDEAIVTQLSPLISKSWETLILSDQSQTSIAPLAYHHIDSIDLYAHVQHLAHTHQWEYVVGKVSKLTAIDDAVAVEVNNTNLIGKYIFDSRTPQHLPTQKHQVHIHQSFVGWMIETQEETLSPDVFKFMDFNIAQQGYTQFVYILPFSSTKALVEVTRFGSNPIQKEEAEAILASYIQTHFGAHQIQAIEMGCIPMSNAQIDKQTIPGVVSLGARNYQIKPSTGYAFKNMFHQAQEIALQLKAQGNPALAKHNHTAPLRGRFAFYDALLLDILKNNPQHGKPIFTALLKKVDITKTLKFLDEKTTLAEELSIFYHLPWKPFLSALFKKHFEAGWVQPFILLLITLGLLGLGNFTPPQTWVGYPLLLIGLVAVGIPHGAIDHLLETGQWNLKSAPLFVFKYLLVAAAMAMVWLLLPSMALVFFLVYSAWHFGEADGKKWTLSPLLSFAWGASVLLFILGRHPAEVNALLTTMGAPSFPLSVPIFSLLPWLVWSIYQRQIGLTLTVVWLSLSGELPLLLSFGLYFIGQHSITGWQHLQSHLQLSHPRMWLQALPFNVGAWMLLGVFYWFWPSMASTQTHSLWGVFFIFIACISFPHVIVMHRMYQKQQQ